MYVMFIAHTTKFDIFPLNVLYIVREYTFSYGFPFFYWDYYKNKDKQQLENQQIYVNLYNTI